VLDGKIIYILLIIVNIEGMLQLKKRKAFKFTKCPNTISDSSLGVAVIAHSLADELTE